MVNQWDDHEVTNNWYPGEILDLPQYTEKNVDVLAARARQAFGEYHARRLRRADEAGRIYRRIAYGPLLDVFVLDMRTFKSANPDADGATGTVLGEAQLAWLKRELAARSATWKVIAADLPIGLDRRRRHRCAGRGLERATRAPRGGREREIAELLAFAKREA